MAILRLFIATSLYQAMKLLVRRKNRLSRQKANSNTQNERTSTINKIRHVFRIRNKRRIILIWVTPAKMPITTITNMTRPLLTRFMTRTRIRRRNFNKVRINRRMNKMSFISNTMTIFKLRRALCRSLSINGILLIRRTINIMSINSSKIRFIRIMMRTNDIMITILILMIRTRLRITNIIPLPTRNRINIPLFFIRTTRMTRDLLTIRFRRPRATIIIFSMRRLPSIKLFTTNLTMQTSPNRLPPITLTRIVSSIRLVILRNMCIRSIITTNRLISFNVDAFTTLMNISNVTNMRRDMTCTITPTRNMTRMTRNNRLRFLHGTIMKRIILRNTDNFRYLMRNVFRILMTITNTRKNGRTRYLITCARILTRARISARFKRQTLLTNNGKNVRSVINLRMFIGLRRKRIRNNHICTKYLRRQATTIRLVTIFTWNIRLPTHIRTRLRRVFQCIFFNTSISIHATMINGNNYIVRFTSNSILCNKQKRRIRQRRLIIQIKQNSKRSIRHNNTMTITRSTSSGLSNTNSKSAHCFLCSFFRVTSTFRKRLFKARILSNRNHFLPFRLRNAFTFRILLNNSLRFTRNLHIQLRIRIRRNFALCLCNIRHRIFMTSMASNRNVNPILRLRYVIAVRVNSNTLYYSTCLRNNSHRQLFNLSINSYPFSNSHHNDRSKGYRRWGGRRGLSRIWFRTRLFSLCIFWSTTGVER